MRTLLLIMGFLFSFSAFAQETRTCSDPDSAQERAEQSVIIWFKAEAQTTIGEFMELLGNIQYLKYWEHVKTRHPKCTFNTKTGYFFLPGSPGMGMDIVACCEASDSPDAAAVDMTREILKGIPDNSSVQLTRGK